MLPVCEGAPSKARVCHVVILEIVDIKNHVEGNMEITRALVSRFGFEINEVLDIRENVPLSLQLLSVLVPLSELTLVFNSSQLNILDCETCSVIHTFLSIRQV